MPRVRPNDNLQIYRHSAPGDIRLSIALVISDIVSISNWSSKQGLTQRG